MSKVNKEEAPAKSPTSKENKVTSIDSYACTECPSQIEIISINAKKNTITFECENHGEKTMPINEYISLMEKNIYLFSTCSICSLSQNENKDIFFYCTKCQQIICNNQNCINKHYDNNAANHENRSQENFIDNNKRGILCASHLKKKNEAFCFECNKHLCRICLKGGEHMKHCKASKIEFEVSDENKVKFNNIIKKYKKKKLQLQKEKEKKEKELLKEKRKKIKKLNDVKTKNLEEIENKLEEELNNLKLKYENDVNLIKNKFDELSKKCTDDYDYDKEIINEMFDDKIEKLECNKKIKEINDFLLINEIIKNTQEKYQNNYFNNLNFNNVLLNYEKNQDNDENELLDRSESDNEIDKLKNNYFSSDPNNINSSLNLVENSYADCFDQNSFLVYNSINNKKLILVYSTKQKSIIFYDINSKENIHEIENAHENYIVSLRLDPTSNENNILLSVTQSDIKLWDIKKTYNCILQINNTNNIENYLASACLINMRKNNVIIACNKNDLGNNGENIKIYYVKENKVKRINEIENSDNQSYFIDICYDNENSKYYIITANLGNVKSYDYYTKKEYHTYCDNDDEEEKFYHISAITFINKKIFVLIESCKDGKIRIWDFHNNKLINKIYFDDIIPTSLCVWNDQYLLFGTEEKGINLVDISNNNLCNSLNERNLCAIVKIKHSEYGECILSQSEEECPIKIWIKKTTI